MIIWGETEGFVGETLAFEGGTWNTGESYPSPLLAPEVVISISDCLFWLLYWLKIDFFHILILILKFDKMAETCGQTGRKFGMPRGGEILRTELFKTNPQILQ